MSERVENIYESISEDDRKCLYRLEKTKKNLEKLYNLNEEEYKIYGNKNDYEKLLFEVNRVLSYIGDRKDEKYLGFRKQLTYISSIVNLREKSGKNGCSDLFEMIIMIELSLNMKVGLFSEFMDVYKKYSKKRVRG